jgi:hypothetical protein
MPSARTVFSFPNPVNEKAARAVAGQVLVSAVFTLLLSITVSEAWLWLTAALAVGFLARVLTGPTLSPFGQLATRVLAKRLGAPKSVPGAPKRFAQAMGFVMTATATVLLATGHPLGTQILLGMLIVAAGLESIAAYCLGCKFFAIGMRLGLIPESVCRECADVPGYFRARAAARSHTIA